MNKNDGNICFDSIKEDINEGYQCECGGSVTKTFDGKTWKCDTCDFEHDGENK